MPSSALRDLQSLKNPAKAAFFPKFFKTGKGQYGEGDVFLGITVPQIRSVTRKHRDLPLQEIEHLLSNAYHEARLLGLLILVDQFEHGDPKGQKKIVAFYLSHLTGVNNWDLVDSSAAQILGTHLLETGDTRLLLKLAKSKSLWEQRIAIVATYAFIRARNYDPTIDIATILLHHPHDLIHKAVGWMLREMGKRDEDRLRAFLNAHAPQMPRTMLRYAIEKFDAQTRAGYLRQKGKITD